MKYDKDKVDDAVLALLSLTMWHDPPATLAWKGYDWATLDRLHDKGYIANPRGRCKSVIVTSAGRAKAEELFRQLFYTPRP